MCHEWQSLLQSAEFFAALLDLDVRHAAELRDSGCPHCGGRLHRADYERKPRGEPAGLADDFVVRFSFCCAEDGCRRRVTPPSVRFLGRKVYVGLAVVIAAAVMQGETPARMAQVIRLLGCSARTVRRWMSWWVTRFAECRFFRSLRGLMRGPIDTSSLPLSLVMAMQSETAGVTLQAVLLLLRPITGSSALGAQPA